MPLDSRKKEQTTILFVVNDPRFFITHRLSLAKGIREAGYVVHIAVPTIGYGSARSIIEAESITVHEVAIERQGINPLRDLRALAQLTFLYRRLHPDIVHHVTVKPMLYGSLAARFTGVPGVVNAVSGKGRLFSSENWPARARAALMRMLYRLILRHPNMLTIFQNDDDRTSFIHAGIVSEGSSAVIRGSGTEVARFDPTAEPESPPIVLLPARMLRQKGIREFVSAANTLKRERIGARFVVVGDTAGNRDAISSAEVAQIRSDGNVELWGWSDDLPAVMSRSAIICLPSYHEGVPKALLDACAAGRPIVATDIPGCRAVVTDRENGILVPPKDSASLANAIRELVADLALRRRMGVESARRAPEFDVSLVIQRTLKVYTALGTEPTKRLD